MNLYLIIKANIKTYLYALILLTLSTFILSVAPFDKPTNYFPPNYLYIDDKSEVDLGQLDDDIKGEYCTTKKLNYSGDETQQVIAHNPYSLDQQIYYLELAYLPETTVRTQVLNGAETNTGVLTSYIDVAYLFDCNLREDVIYRESSNSIEEMIVGHYPQTENEVLISENYALKQLQLNEDLETYEDLIGTKVTLNSNDDGKNAQYDINNQEFTISGIYAGSNDLYLYPNQEVTEYWVDQEPELEQALWIKFDSEQAKEDYIKSLSPDVTYLDSDIVNKVTIVQLIKYTIVILMSIYIWILLFYKNKQIIDIIEFHNYQISTKLKVYIFNILLILVYILLNSL